MRDIALQLWRIYAVLSVVCCAGLMLLGMSLYDAVYHTFTAISTGGFSPRNESIAAYDSFGIEAWLCLFMVLGGISFMLHAWLIRRHWERWRKEEEAKVFFYVLLALIVMIAADLVWMGKAESIGGSIRASMFQVISIMTTTGYATENFDGWPAFSRVLLVLSMFVGGCAGSTAGGIKLGRFILLWKVLRQQVIAAFRPNQVITLRLNGNVVDEEMKLQTVFFITLAGLATAVGTVVVSLLEPGLDAVSSLSAVVASLFNIGPGLGAVGPTSNFAGLAPATKVFLSFMMVLGRLEFFALLVLFAPSLWRRY
jgi:trk system potassium uptake protein TrkH